MDPKEVEMKTLNRFFRTVGGVWGGRAKPLHGRQPQFLRYPTLEALEPRWVPSATNGTSAITGNFNGTAIPAGDTLWFSSDFKVNGLGQSPVTLQFTQGSIAFTANGTTYTVNIPNADVTFSPTATTATTTFNASQDTWETILPMHFSGNGFLSGAALALPGGLPGGIHNVTWQGQFSASTPGVSVNWQWAAAAYKNFSSDYNALDVKPVDDNHVSAYQNSDHAGTPEAFLPFVVGGATGGGGSNFTGSLSATAQVTPATSSGISGQITSAAGIALGGEVVTLTTTNSQGQLVTFTATTDSNGNYQFTGLEAGNYTLNVVPPLGSSITEQVGTVNGTSNGTDVGNGTISNVSLTAGSTGSNYNFQIALLIIA
jgi:hypothetical protein